MAGNNSGQTINDRILAARHSLAGQGLAKAVCKATTEELIGPKKKHLDYLLLCTEEPNVSIPSLANLLLERTQSGNWIVVFKGLTSIHHLMCYGNERFVQFLASSNANFQLSGFLDKSGVAGYDMSPFIRRYAKYLSEKAFSYRAIAFDFCKVKRGKDGGILRSMPSDKLLKTLPILMAQVDALIDFDVTTNDLNNGVINCAFMLLFRDLIRLFACYNDGIINLLEKYFDMNKKHGRDALDIYKKFLLRMDRVADFLKVAENVGMKKGDLPDLTKAPSSLLEALESHLASLEGRKPGSTAATPTGASGSSTIDEKLQIRLLAEEEQAMAKYKEQHRATNPFTESLEQQQSTNNEGLANNETPNILDLFGVSDSSNGRHSEDLLQLGNPFANIFSSPSVTTNSSFTPNSSSSSSAFNNNINYNNNNNNNNNTPFGVGHSFPSLTTANDAGNRFFGDILQPQNASQSSSNPFPSPFLSSTTTEAPPPKVITGDLDASLANLTSNLNLGFGQSKSYQFNTVKGPPIGASLSRGSDPCFSTSSSSSFYSRNSNGMNPFSSNPHLL